MAKKRSKKRSNSEVGRILAQADNSEKLLTKHQIADYLQLTPRTIELWMARGLPHYKLGDRRTRFDLAEVKSFLRENCAVTRAA